MNTALEIAKRFLQRSEGANETPSHSATSDASVGTSYDFNDRNDKSPALPLPERGKYRGFAQSGEIICIHSEVLGCEVLLAANNADPAVVAATNLPVYWAREFPHLVGLTPDGLRHVHDVRTFFDGELIE